MFMGKSVGVFKSDPTEVVIYYSRPEYFNYAFRQTNCYFRSMQLPRNATVPYRMCWLSSNELRADSSYSPHPRLENSAAVFTVPAASYTLLIEVLPSVELYGVCSAHSGQISVRAVLSGPGLLVEVNYL